MLSVWEGCSVLRNIGVPLIVLSFGGRQCSLSIMDQSNGTVSTMPSPSSMSWLLSVWHTGFLLLGGAAAGVGAYGCSD